MLKKYAKVFYHGDMDGKCSAAIVQRALADTHDVEVEAINYDYDSTKLVADLRDSDVSAEDEIYFVDFTPRMEDIDFLWDDLGLRITILDHHQSALVKFQKHAYANCDDIDIVTAGVFTHHDYGFHCVYDTSMAGCQVTWEHFHTGEPMPEVVRLLGNYDIWNHEDPKVYPCQLGFSLVDCEVDSPEGTKLWDMLLGPQTKEENGVTLVNSALDQIISMGTIAHQYKQEMDRRTVRSGFVQKLGDLTFYLVNSLVTDSYAYDQVKKDIADSVDAFGCFTYNGTTWQFSLRRKSGDTTTAVNKVAELFGGGGHPGAAGFHTNSLPWDERSNAKPSDSE